MGALLNMANIVLSLESARHKDHNFKGITKEQYEEFKKEFIFLKLQGKSFGNAFGEKFGIDDWILKVNTTDKFAMDHIDNCKYVR